MLSFLPAPLRGVLSALLLALNTLFWCWPLFALALLKLVLPFAPVQRTLRYGMHWIAESWMAVNSFWMDLARDIDWDVQGRELVDMRHSYLVTSNHQSWADILVLQYQLSRRMPILKFFLKQELIWVPVIGLCWWALEFPFMKRFSKEYLAKHPEKRGEDLATTRRACERYRTNRCRCSTSSRAPASLRPSTPSSSHRSAICCGRAPAASPLSSMRWVSRSAH